MPAVMVRFVQSTYVLATIVNISNISADTDMILTKLFGPNFLGSKFLKTTIFWLRLGEMGFWGQNAYASYLNSYPPENITYMRK